jgi:pyruvate/2-oxoglutarate/acetoin dehydrogenase E1 component
MIQNGRMQVLDLEFNFNMKYFDELKRAMTWLGNKPESLFIGQAVEYPGTGMFNTLTEVPSSKLLELPVIEETQMGMSIGLSLAGYLPISIYPRWNFLLLATNQLVNHLDKIPIYSDYNPKIIIRTAIGSERPLHPQAQHIGDFTDAFRLMLKTVNVVRLDEPEQIFDEYCKAYDSKHSTLLVEWGDFYNEK